MYGPVGRAPVGVIIALGAGAFLIPDWRARVTWLHVVVSLVANASRYP